MVMANDFVLLEIPTFDHLFAKVSEAVAFTEKQHSPTLSSPQLNRYGCRGLTASPRTVEM